MDCHDNEGGIYNIIVYFQIIIYRKGKQKAKDAYYRNREYFPDVKIKQFFNY